MKKCLRCNVTIKDQSQICPLCAGELISSTLPGEDTYPAVAKQRQRMKKAVRIYSLVAIAVFVAMRILAIVVGFERHWDYLVGAGLLYIWLTFHISFLGRRGYRFKMIMQTVLALLLVIVVDGILGFLGWSLNYVLPAVFVLVDVAVLILMLVNSRNWQSYLPIQLLVVLLSLSGVVLYLTGVVDDCIPALTGFFIVCVIFVATILVGGQRSIQELRRRFHL